MTSALISENHVDDHHIFPDAYLLKEGITETRRRDCVLNRTLIDRTTNQRLSRRSPKDYFEEMYSELGDAQFRVLMQSHLLPVGSNSPIMTNDFDAFLQSRCELIGEALKGVTQNV